MRLIERFRKKDRMYTINIIEYYFELAVTWVSQYVMYLWNEFMDFSPIIKIATISVIFSALLIIATFIRMAYNSWVNRKWRKEAKKLDDKYGDGIRYILSDDAKSNMTRQEIINVLDIPDDKKKDTSTILKGFREKFSFARLVYKSRISEEASHDNQKNLQILLDVFAIPVFLEEVVNNGKMRRKAEALIMMRAFKLPVNQWIANQLRNSKRYRMRRLSSYASIMTSSNSDLEYFESEFFDKNCCIYDEIQLGYVLQRRKSMNRRIPNLAQLANAQTNPSTQAVFVRLMRQFDQKEFCGELEDLFVSTGSKELVQEICRTWGYLRYVPGETLMQDIILTQTDETKVAIMHALTRLKTGNSLDVMLAAYKDSGDEYVRYEALRCIFNYGPAGYAKFQELKMAASENEKNLFEFFSHPLTRESTKLSKDDIYESIGGEETLYSVG